MRTTSALGGMPGGREFDLPYKKSLYITRDPLPPEFCSSFARLVDLVNSHPGVDVVFQGVVGGGLFQENGDSGTTRMHRLSKRARHSPPSGASYSRSRAAVKASRDA